MLNALLSVMTLLVVLVGHAQSANFSQNISGVDLERLDAEGSFDLESWVCSMARLGPVSYIYTSQCAVEQVVRGMVIVEFILSISAVAFSAWGFQYAKRRWEEVIEKKKARSAFYHEDDERDGNGWD